MDTDARQIVEDFGGVPTDDEISIGTSTITLNSSETIRTKAEIAQASYGGTMTWELWQDATGERSLLQVVKEVMR